MAIVTRMTTPPVRGAAVLTCVATFFLCASCATGYTAAISNPLLQGDIETVDDFEDENDFWSAAGIFCAEDYSLETDLSDEWCSAGEYCGQWSFANIPQGCSATFVCESLITNDWSGAQAVLADVNNVSQGPVELYVAVECALSGNTLCTEVQSLGVGENVNVTFRLDETLRDKDGNAVALQENDEVKSLAFKVQGKKGAGTILIDEIRLLR